jgi:DNA-binding transcriptional LysR family regulator
LRVTAPILFGALFLPDLVAELLTRYPEVQLTLDLTDRVVDLVNEGYDVAIRAGALSDSSWIAHKLGQAMHRLFASPTYLRAHGTPVKPRDLADHDCLIVGTQPHAVWPFRSGRKAQHISVRGRLASNNFLVVRDAAIAGLGICRIPGFLALEAMRRGKLVAVLDEHLHDPTPMHVIYPSARHVSPKVRAFVDLVRARLGTQPFVSGDEPMRTRAAAR